VKRRKALKSLGLGLSAGLLMPEFLASCKKDSPGPEVSYAGTVAVVGAGAAGLYAADILRSKGVKVVVLEASAQSGGRIKSYRAPGDADVPTASFLFVAGQPSIADFPLELGADVVFGSDSIWGKILTDLTVSTFDLSNTTNQFVLSNLAQPATAWGADGDFNAVENFVGGIPNLTGTGVSIKDTAGVSDRGQALLNSQAGNFYGSSSDRIGAGGLGTELKLITHDSKQLTLKANQMQDVLTSRFTQLAPYIKFNMPVQSIDYSGDTVAISVGTGTQITANKVIVTVPLSIMKSGGVSFNPALPSAMTTSLANFGMDDCIRVILDFKENFWGETTGFIWGGTTAPQYVNGGAGRSENFLTLTITICGPMATSLSAMGADMITPILAELDSIYYNADGGFATKYIRRQVNTDGTIGPILYTIQDWSKEEFIRGSFSYPLLNATHNDRIAIGQSIDGKVFFAGEATDVSGSAGTINGALASAERVAMEVVQSILNP
jgi:monoamine oxidase